MSISASLIVGKIEQINFVAKAAATATAAINNKSKLQQQQIRVKNAFTSLLLVCVRVFVILNWSISASAQVLKKKNLMK